MLQNKLVKRLTLILIAIWHLPCRQTTRDKKTCQSRPLSNDGGKTEANDNPSLNLPDN